ncbi:MAG: hypothetical protein J6B34_02005 [Clostridia bacterium]|nr:hypothetical protein [Clostridia bacterium]
MINFLPTEHHKRIFKDINPSLRWDLKKPIDLHRLECEKRLRELLCINQLEKCDADIQILENKEINGVKSIRFALQTEAGYYASCYLALPLSYSEKEATLCEKSNTLPKKNDTLCENLSALLEGVRLPSEKKLPLCVCLQGHVSGAHLSLGIEKFEYDSTYLREDGVDFCLQAVKNGFAGLAIEQRGFGENGGDPDKGYTKCAHTAMSALLMGRTLLGERVWDVMRVVDGVLENFGDYVTMDGSVLMGMSGGGTVTYYTACLDSRFEVYVPGVALCTFEDSIVEIEHCVCNYVPNMAKYFDMSDLAVLVAPKKLVVVSGKTDRWFPLKGAKGAFEKIKETYSALGCEENCVQVVGNGGHSFFVNEAWEAINRLLKQN